MTENLTKRFIHLRCFGLASKAVSELRLDHAERGFNVAALVILLQEPRLIELKIVVHAPPQIASCLFLTAAVCHALRAKSAHYRGLRVDLERDVRHGVMVYYRLQIVFRQVRLISRDFRKREVFSSGVNQRLEVPRHLFHRTDS